MADQLSDTFNPFGLTDSRTLEDRRRARRMAEAAQRRNRLSGMDLAGAEAGNALGFILGKALTRAGVIKDIEGERATAVDKAAKDAQAAFDQIPEEQREKGSFGTAIQRRRTLIAQLEEAGLQKEADTVRTQLIDLHDQQAKFRKLNAETERLDLQIDREREELGRTKKGLREKDELTRLQNAHALLDISDPVQAARADQIMSRIDKITTITGTTEFDPSASDKVTLRKLEQSLFDNQRALDGFVLASDEYDPSFLTLGTQIKNFAVKAVEIAGLPISEEAKQGLRDFTAFRQRTSINLNAYIKAITGAQMSNPEATRLRKDVPTQDDSPTEYKRKLGLTLERLQAVRSRGVAAMGAAGDRQEFLKIMTTSLDEFIEMQPEQDDATTARADAERALADLEAVLRQGQ
ncbi:hypothetical protein CMI47_04505 [Candidatus Pacearchaeota archaeon]|jgi:hypothetical protein|nr:hypothetical protein [Candidatus Pacearchaeota archaeon]